MFNLPLYFICFLGKEPEIDLKFLRTSIQNKYLFPNEYLQKYLRKIDFLRGSKTD